MYGDISLICWKMLSVIITCGKYGEFMKLDWIIGLGGFAYMLVTCLYDILFR